ncbi:uncharacterized protein LOC114187173 [Vigna unguiculata]|uniref:uncharacterized protein LOC114187173 n=1 Tax=Vigna unguiculata TaxID=3917 RepID=UPI0010161FAE|nr:uncharacterized protein LOC114187173 [Vigna unguiculata]
MHTLATSMANNIPNTQLKFDRYKYSSSEFPEEHAVIYSSHEIETRTSTLRLSVKRDMVLCRFAHDMCKDHPIRFHMKITALKDSNGVFKLGEVVAGDGTDRDLRPFPNRIPKFLNRSGGGERPAAVEKEHARFAYRCEEGSGDFGVKSGYDCEKWRFCHSYDGGERGNLTYFVSIWCNSDTGLSVLLVGPFMNDGKGGRLRMSRREVSGEPPKGLIANAERDLKLGKEYTVLKRNQFQDNMDDIKSSLHALTTEIRYRREEATRVMNIRRERAQEQGKTYGGESPRARSDSENFCGRNSGLQILQGKEKPNGEMRISSEEAARRMVLTRRLIERCEVGKNRSAEGRAEINGDGDSEGSVINFSGGEGNELINNSVGHSTQVAFYGPVYLSLKGHPQPLFPSYY